MVSLRQLDPSEVPADALRTRTTVDHSEYASALDDVAVNMWYEVPLEGVNRRAVIRRLNQAASERTEGDPIKLRWAQQKHTKEGVAMFKVIAANSPEAQDASDNGESDSESNGTSNGEGETASHNRRGRRGTETAAEPELVGAGA